MVLAFLDFLERERSNSVRTRNVRLVVIHSFFRHVAYSEPEVLALAQRILSIGPKRTTKRVVEFLRENDDPMVRQLKDDRDLLRPYWAAADDLARKMGKGKFIQDIWDKYVTGTQAERLDLQEKYTY